MAVTLYRQVGKGKARRYQKVNLGRRRRPADNGSASYLQVLTSETNYFSAELNLVQAQLNERLALVQLYQALGGGWQQ
jgi:outer membrane protein TolC